MKRKFSILLILTCLILAMAGCYIVKNQSSSHYTITEGKKITDTYDYTVCDDFNGMSLKIDLALTKGEVTFELKDPNGNIQWEGTSASEKTINETKEFEKIVGDWTLNFTSVDNKADGKLKLEFNRL